MVMFQDEAAAKKMLKERVHSREWWILFWTDVTSDIIIQIEQTHYSGDDNGAFEIVTGGFGRFPFIAVVLAKKDRMSPEQLADLLQQHSTRELDRSAFESHDIIHFDHATLLQFMNWIGDPPSETNGHASY